MRYIKYVMSVLAAMLAFNTYSLAKTNDDYDWGNVSIGGGGYVTGIDVHEDGTVYIRTDISGAYKKENDKWIPLTEHITYSESNLFGIDGLAVASKDSSLIYAAMGKYDYAEPCGLYKSVDGGKTWENTGLNAKFSANQGNRMKGECVAIDPNYNNIVFVLTADNNMYKSSDSGKTWTSVTSFPANSSGKSGRCIVFDKNTDRNGKTRTIYADIQGVGVYCSTDGGNSWSLLGGTNAPSSVYRMVVDKNGSLVVAASNGLLRYKNRAWEVLNNYSLYGETDFCAVDVDKNDPNRIIAVYKNGVTRKDFENLIFYTENGGASWVNITDAAFKNNTVSWWPEYYFSAHTSDIAFGSGNEVWFTDWYGVWKTDNIKANNPLWTNNVKGIENIVAFDIACPPSGAPLLVGVADNSGMRIEDINTYPADKMKNPSTPITSSIDFCESNPDIVARIGTGTFDGGRISISTDNGKTFTEKSPFTFAGGKIAVSCGGSGNLSMVVVPVEDSPWYSSDGGNTWHKSNFPNVGGVDFVRKVWSWNHCLQSDRVLPNTFYLINPFDGMFYASTDGGATWTKRSDNPIAYAAQLETVPGREGHIWMTRGDGGLALSVDGGYTFEKLNNVQTATQCSVGKERDGSSVPTVYIYGSINNVHGVFRSTDYGQTWDMISNDTTAIGNDVTCMKADRQTFGTVYIGTNGRGVYYGRENVIHKFFEENRAHNFCGQTINDYAGYIEEKSGTVSYSGAYSYRFGNAKFNMRYTGWDKDGEGQLKSIGDISGSVRTAIENGTAYICGWFYAEKGAQTKTVRLLYGETPANQRSRIIGLPDEEWVFLCEKITDPDVRIGIVDTSGEGSVYVDDFCIISTADGSEPAPTKQILPEIPGIEQDVYVKTLRELYTDDLVHAWSNSDPNVVLTAVDSERKKIGDNALKFTGALLLGYTNDQRQNCALGEINDEITNAVKDGRAYWSAWVYIDTETTDVMGQDLDFYIPTNPRERGEWIWVCMPLTKDDLTQENMYIKSEGAWTWIDDVKLITFEDMSEGLNFDKYLIYGAGDGNTLRARSKITVDGSVYNSSSKAEDLTLIIAEYSAGMLVDVKLFNEGKALPYRKNAFGEDYRVSANIGNQINVFLWNSADSLNPLRNIDTFTIN